MNLNDNEAYWLVVDGHRIKHLTELTTIQTKPKKDVLLSELSKDIGFCKSGAKIVLYEVKK